MIEIFSILFLSAADKDNNDFDGENPSERTRKLHASRSIEGAEPTTENHLASRVRA